MQLNFNYHTEKQPSFDLLNPCCTQSSIKVGDLSATSLKVRTVISLFEQYVRRSADGGEDLFSSSMKDRLKLRAWRGGTALPDMTYKPLAVDFGKEIDEIDSVHKVKVEERCFALYKRALKAFEKTVADALIRYIHPCGEPTMPFQGELLRLSHELSRRYLELYRAYVNFEMSKNIPMLCRDSGVLKLQGFTSSEIISMREDCKKLMEILNQFLSKISEIEATLNEPQEIAQWHFAYDKFVDTLLHENKSYVDELKSYPRLTASLSLLLSLYEQSLKLPTRELITRVAFMFKTFGKSSNNDIVMLLHSVAEMKLFPDAKEDERLCMEISHRVIGEGSCSPGYSGINPFRYVETILAEEVENKEAAFRLQMFFVYMSNHFANLVFLEDGFLEFANSFLCKHQCGWTISQEFVDAMRAQGSSNLPPIFRYGPQARLNAVLRVLKTDRSADSESKNAVTVEELIRPPSAHEKSYRDYLEKDFRFKLSRSEILGLTGELDLLRLYPKSRVKYWSGSSMFHLKTAEEVKLGASTLKSSALEYLKIVEELCLPTLSGISGTLDQSFAIAGLVGIGIQENDDERPTTLQVLKAALIAFMLPCSDHTLHEILQSSKSFGLDYIPGPGFESYVFPPGGEEFIEVLRQEQAKRNMLLPSDYLKADYALNAFHESYYE